MTRETKAGIVVSCAFVGLVGTVFVNRHRACKDHAAAPEAAAPLKAAEVTPRARVVHPTPREFPAGLRQAAHADLQPEPGQLQLGGPPPLVPAAAAGEVVVPPPVQPPTPAPIDISAPTPPPPIPTAVPAPPPAEVALPTPVTPPPLPPLPGHVHNGGRERQPAAVPPTVPAAPPVPPIPVAETPPAAPLPSAVPLPPIAPPAVKITSITPSADEHSARAEPDPNDEHSRFQPRSGLGTPVAASAPVSPATAASAGTVLPAFPTASVPTPPPAPIAAPPAPPPSAPAPIPPSPEAPAAPLPPPANVGIPSASHSEPPAPVPVDRPARRTGSGEGMPPTGTLPPFPGVHTDSPARPEAPPAPPASPEPSAAVMPPIVASAAPAVRLAQHTLVTGDTYDNLAALYYRRPELAAALRQYNQNDAFATPAVKAGNLTPGDKIWIPPAAGAGTQGLVPGTGRAPGYAAGAAGRPVGADLQGHCPGG